MQEMNIITLPVVQNHKVPTGDSRPLFYRVVKCVRTGSDGVQNFGLPPNFLWPWNEGGWWRGGSLTDTVARSRQQNHCGLSLKNLCHRTSVNSCALMTNDGILVCQFTFTSSALLRNQLKLTKMNHHEIEAEVQTTDALLFLDHREDDPQKYSKPTEYNFKFVLFFF